MTLTHEKAALIFALSSIGAAVVLFAVGSLVLVFPRWAWTAWKAGRDQRRIRREWRRRVKDMRPTLVGGYSSPAEPPSVLPKIDPGPGPGSLPRKGGYSGSRPASEVPPPPSTPSATIFPRGVEDMLSSTAYAHKRYENGRELIHRGAYKDCLEHECLMDPGNPKGAYVREKNAARAGQLRTPGPSEPVTENLSAYIDGEIRRGTMWSDAIDALGLPDDATVSVGVSTAEDWPDPDKSDCPTWLPNDPAVPFKDRTPCHLDAHHNGDHEPMDRGSMERAEAIAKRVRFGKWDDAAKQYDAEVSLDVARHRRWVQLTVIGSPPIGLPMRQADPLEVHNAIAPLLGFELVSSVSATVLDTPAAVND